MRRRGFSTVQSILVGLVLAGAGLFLLSGLGGRTSTPPASSDVIAATEATAEESAAPRDPAPATAPAETPAESVEPDVAADELKIVVSLRRRMLWLVKGADTVMRAPVAIGMNAGFEYEGKKWFFETPKGRRRVLAKAPDPTWTPPEWHYYEKATKKGLHAVKLQKGDTIPLEDGSFLAVTDSAVGRINHFGYFAAFTPGVEIIFDGKIYIPPLDSPQRRVPDALGPFKLDMGDGYLIHGTHYYNEESIGEAVSHGCVRMNNDDLTRLYRLVPRGTVVEII